MQILLNLLPDEKRLCLAQRFRSRFFLWQAVLLLLLEIFYIAILGGIFYFLSQEVKLAEQAELAYGEYDTEAQKLSMFREKFQEVNASAIEIERYSRNHLRWTNLFTLLDQLTGPGIVVVDIMTRDYTVTLNGQAATRENFLAFEEQLKQSNCISDVKVPISNLFSQKEIEFQVDFNIKRECLLGNTP